MAQRRLANGRFAKVTELPMARRRTGGPEGMTGSIIIRTNAGAVADGVAQINPRVTASLAEAATQRAAKIQGHLQGAASAAYHRSATGRFARGIHASVQKSKGPNSSKNVIRVTMINYRESRYLTNIGGSGYFKHFPVEPYTIFADGALDTNLANKFGKITQHSKASALRIQRSFASGRLKVPRRSQGVVFVAFRQPGRGGGESRRAEDQFGPFSSDDVQSAGFFYPLWVHHPGFAADVVSEVVNEEGGVYVSEQVGLVVASLETVKINDLGGKQLVVSEEIPLPEPPSVSYSRGSISRGSFH